MVCGAAHGRRRLADADAAAMGVHRAGGMLGVFGQLLMTVSYRYAEASTLAPLDYRNLLIAVALGYYVFAEIPQLDDLGRCAARDRRGPIILWREYQRYAAVPATVVPND